MLYRYVGDSREMLKYACEHTPSLIIDCGNIADPHRMISYADDSIFHEVYVIEVQMLYMLRDVLVTYQEIAQNYKVIIITPFRHLFHYQNEQENENIIIQVKELIQELSSHTKVINSLLGEQVNAVWDIPLIVNEE